jgi:hypothetical protein
MSVEPAHLRSNPPASAGPARPLKLALPPSPPGLPLTSLAGPRLSPRSILIAALITISAMRAHSISQSYFIVPRRSLKMLRGSLAPSGYRPQTTSLSRSPMTLAALRLSSGTPTTSARSSSIQMACFPSSTVVTTQRRKKEKESSQKKKVPKRESPSPKHLPAKASQDNTDTHHFLTNTHTQIPRELNLVTALPLRGGRGRLPIRGRSRRGPPRHRHTVVLRRDAPLYGGGP